MYFWSSRKDKDPLAPVPRRKKHKSSNKSVQQAAKSNENTKHATAGTSAGEQRGGRSTNDTDASRHSFDANNGTDNKRKSYSDRCETSEQPDNEERNRYEARAYERGKQERDKEARRKQTGYGSESSRSWHE